MNLILRILFYFIGILSFSVLKAALYFSSHPKCYFGHWIEYVWCMCVWISPKNHPISIKYNITNHIFVCCKFFSREYDVMYWSEKIHLNENNTTLMNSYKLYIQSTPFLWDWYIVYTRLDVYFLDSLYNGILW